MMAKTILEMDSGWGVPVGVLLLIFAVIKMMWSNSSPPSSGSGSSGYKGFADYTAADWRKHEAERKRRKGK